MRQFKFISIFLSVMLLARCECPDCGCSETQYPESAVIPVAVDWSISGLDPEESSKATNSVHRLSLRFYPSDGGEVIVRFMESDLYNDTVEIPVGLYSVIAINEAVTDSYWSGSVNFTDSEDYDSFAAELVVSDGVEVAEPKPIASWSLDSFEITEEMAAYTRGVTQYSDLSEYEQQQLEALLVVVMKALTRSVRVEVTTENLGSAQSMSASVTGLSKRIGIVSGDIETGSITHSFDLDSFDYSDTTRADTDYEADGVASGESLCFGHSDDSEDGYTLDLDVLLSDGTKHDEDVSGIDVEGQITPTDASSDYLVEHSLTLRVVEESVSVKDWGSGEEVSLN